jgi:hypothetical protein
MFMHTFKKAVQKDDTSLKLEYGSMEIGSNENKPESSNEQEKSELITEIIVWGTVVLLCILTL